MKLLLSIKTKYTSLSKVSKASLWFVLCGFMQRGVSILTTPIFTRLLSTSEYGVYSVFNSWLEIVTIFATLKLGHGVYVKGLVKYKEDQARFTSALLGLGCSWLSGFFLIYWFFRDFWNSILGLSTYMMICMFIMMFSTIAYNFWAAKQRNEYNYVKLVILTICVTVLKPIFGILAVLSTELFKVEARLTSLAAVEFFVYLGLFFGLIKGGKRFYHREYWTYALAYNLPLVPHFLAQVILNHSDRIMIKHMVGFSEAGIYSLAYSLAMILTMLNTSLQNAIRPWMFNKIRSGHSKDVHSVATIACVVVAVSNLLLILFSPEIVFLFADKSYQQAMHLIPPITMGVYFAFLYNLFVNAQMYFEKTTSIMSVSIICSLLNLVLNYFFIQRYGYAAAAYTTLFSYVLMAILHYLALQYLSRRYNAVADMYNFKAVLVISLLFVLFGFCFGVIVSFPTIKYFTLICCILCIIFYRNKLLSYFSILTGLRKL